MPSYTNIVRSLRIIVPAMGALLLVLFFLWPVVTKINLPKIDNAQITGDRTELVNPRYEGQDESGARFLLTAERAIQTRANAGIITLVAPAASLVNADNSEGARANAATGMYDEAGAKLTLQDTVTLTTPEGDLFQTPSAEIDLNAKIISGAETVSGDGPRMTLTAQGFTLNQQDKTLTLSGPVKLVLKEETHETDITTPAPAAP
jgi:LPS export ABC transporter protein LptC